MISLILEMDEEKISVSDISKKLKDHGFQPENSNRWTASKIMELFRCE